MLLNFMKEQEQTKILQNVIKNYVYVIMLFVVAKHYVIVKNVIKILILLLKQN